MAPLPSSPLVFRARRAPVWLTSGMAALLGLIALSGLAAGWPFGDPGSPGVGAALALLVLAGAPALFLLKLGNDVRRARVVLGAGGVELRVSRFRLWGLRPLGSARLAWREIHGVQPYEIPNFAARSGTQVDYVIHTVQGAFAVSSMQFADAARIAALVAEGVGRAVGELPPGVVPVGARGPVDRRRIRLMRGLGWVALGAGVACPVLLSLAWLRGSPLPPATVGGVAVASGVLITLGRSLRRFSLK